MHIRKKYLIIKGCAGLGNRLVTLYSAIKYCEKTERKLVIDWADGQFDLNGINAFDKYFAVNFSEYLINAEIENWENMSHSSPIFKSNKNSSVYDLFINKSSRFFSRLPAKFFLNDFLKKSRRRWQPINNGNYCNSLNYGSDMSFQQKYDVLYYIDFLPEIDYTALPKYISVKNPIQDKISQISKTIKINSSIGIHIRCTDKKPTVKMEKVISYLKTKHPDEQIYLATDSLEIETMFKENFGNLVVYDKYKPQLNGEGLHQWALYQKRDELKAKLFEDSVIEMFLLSRCDILYYQGNSTYSNISRVYHSNSKKCYDWLKL